MSFFVYRALTPDQRRIRLVHLLPQRSDSPGENSNEPLSQEAELHQDSKVSCTLSHASLDQPPDYRALSYTWGDPNDVGSITVDGDSFQVRKSLEIALRQLMCDQPLTLWIDALCIDQDDEIEKTEQVRQMEQIYRRANSVITWLGPGTKESDAVMHWIQRHGALSYKFALGSRPELRLGRLLQDFEATEESIEDEGLREFLRDVSSRLTPGVSESDDVIVAVREFFKRPYWSRVWVVQELAHAKAVEFVCGKENVSEEVLHHALRLLRNFADYQYIKEAHQPRSISSNAAVASFSTRNAISLLKIRRAAGPFPLIHLIRTLKFCRATDPRDKIFALLSFASDAVALDLSPDYQKTINEVYVKATASLIRHGYFDILTLSETRKKVPNLPSWVPDFTRSRYSFPLQQRAINRALLRERRMSGGESAIPSILQPNFTASENKTHVRVFCNLEEASPSLILYAKLVDKVDRVGTPWESGSVGRWLQDMRDMSLSDKAVELVPLKAILRAVVADQEVRQANDKPRLTEDRLEKTYDLLQNMELGAVTTENFVSSGSRDYLYQMQETAHGRRPFGTAKGHFGVGPGDMEPGDILCILDGASIPHILRPQSNGGLRLVGEAYAHGMMDGEVFQRDASLEVIAIR